MTDPNQQAALEAALDQADKIKDSRPDVNAVYLGMEQMNGKPTGRTAIVFVVGEKMSAQALEEAGRDPIPAFIVAGNRAFLTDVVVGPQQEIAVLPVMPTAFALSDLTAWRDFPIPGGAQIAPATAPWVGTLGAAVGWLLKTGRVAYGFVTNRHVAIGEKYPIGWQMCQPDGNERNAIGKSAYSAELAFTGGRNFVDVAFCEATDENGRTRISSELSGIGSLKWTGAVREPQIGDRVVKCGRTTGVTKGMVIGLKANTDVGYGEGKTGKFVDQIIIEAERGGPVFSQPGDSGSMVVFADTLEPAGLLFAGGGTRTTCNRIKYLVDAGARFYQR